MNTTKIARWALSVLIASLVGYMPAAFACSCQQALLEQRYRHSENVFTALVTGAEMIAGRSVRHPRLKTYFDVIETFKGTVPFEFLESGIDGNTCGVSLQIGIEYIFFTRDSGEIGLCSGTIGVSGYPKARRPRGREYLEALRAFKRTGRELAEPWRFDESPYWCSLSTSFVTKFETKEDEIAFPGAVQIRYNKKSPPEATVLPPGSAELKIRALVSHEVSNHPLSISIGDMKFVARTENRQHSQGRFVLYGDDALSALAALNTADAMYLQSRASDAGAMDVRVSTANKGDSISEMYACISQDGA